MLVFLWFIGHESIGFRDVSDRFNIAEASLHRIIRRISVFLSNLSPQVISWPTEAEKEEISNAFQEKGFPRVIGAIDGSHIRVDRPQIDADSYINRKGYHSVHVRIL